MVVVLLARLLECRVVDVIGKVFSVCKRGLEYLHTELAPDGISAWIFVWSEQITQHTALLIYEQVIVS